MRKYYNARCLQCNEPVHVEIVSPRRARKGNGAVNVAVGTRSVDVFDTPRRLHMCRPQPDEAVSVWVRFLDDREMKAANA